MQWNALVPELVVGNYPNARDFYLKVFGFRLCYERAWDQFGYFELEGAELMLLQAPGAPVGELQRPGPKGKGIHFQVEVQRLARSTGSPAGRQRGAAHAGYRRLVPGR
ncbi:VOC family protein [Pseudomonas benzenivorans]|uniref:Glyoxalase/fosfomycin resistance/dioxygenase domain-containing protein n=1 Tax=Pseudomonas benzenivorans TaxID=556533 RepID=A0ABY5H668_9PSED|nr:VOC family protein [Pseudomonas benzenivorans]UTW07812.1 hypothetical protein KDW96_00275 [Pseudomonas benzenivorans]